MDIVQVFNDELQSVLRSKSSVSKAKMVQITRAAMKGVKFYKHIVQAVEKFIARCRPEYMVPGLYVIDSICRQSRHQFGPERDVYTSRFSRNIMMTFETLFANCPPDDKPKIVRVLNLWQKNGVFDSQTVQPLMDMASTASSSARMPPTSPPDVDGGTSSGPKYQSHHYARHSERDTSDGLKFDKNMLDFDYDEDDPGDETPTEAEPPLSSTLNKLGIEQRSHRDDSKIRLYQNNNQRALDNLSKKQPAHDPVLERWQRIVNHQSTSSDSLNTDKQTLDNRDGTRSRSRSPPPSHEPIHIKFNQNSNYTEQQSKREEKAKEIVEQNTREAERAAERERRCLPKIRDKHIAVCSATLWLGHLPKSVTEVDISDAFGEYGSIHSIDLVPPRGCAYVCMDRRQDAKRALNESKEIRLKGCPIKMAWAPGKGFKEYKKLKDFWEADVGASFIPYSRVDSTIDFEVLEEGGIIDEDSLSIEMRERRERAVSEKKGGVSDGGGSLSQSNLSLPLPPMPVMNPQMPPTSIQPFNVPPPNLNMPPPPIALGQGLIPFPPPGVATTSSGSHMTLPPPSMILGQNSTIRDGDTSRVDEPSTSIEQQLSMTERQISMVEQQLNMIQQAQGLGRGPPMMQPLPNLQQHPQIFQQSQPDPMIFDMAMQQQIMHNAQNMLDPSLSMFANPTHYMAPPQMMIPTSMPNGSEVINTNDQGIIQID